MTLAGQMPQFVVHRIRVTPRQVGGLRDPQLAQIGGDGMTDIRYILKASKILTLLCQLSPPFFCINPSHRSTGCGGYLA